MSDETKWVAWMKRGHYDDYPVQSELIYLPSTSMPDRSLYPMHARTPWLDKPEEEGKPMSYMKRKLEDEAEEAAERVVAEMHAAGGEVIEEDYMRPIDQFAYAALNGYLAHGTLGDVDVLALDCYDIAEAMMAERAKRGGE